MKSLEIELAPWWILNFLRTGFLLILMDCQLVNLDLNAFISPINKIPIASISNHISLMASLSDSGTD